MKENRLVLGTAQLSFNYGIIDKKGKPSKKEAFSIMKYAVENGISYFDTAYNYGDSEIIIGKFLNIYKVYKNKINIITKMAPQKKEKLNEKNINNAFFESLHRLWQESIYCYMIHDFNDIKNNCDLINKSFLKLKIDGYIKKIGVSVYDKNHIKFLLKNFDFDLIQVPISIFDQRLLKDNILFKLKNKTIDIYARSIFLQGLIFFNKNNIPLKLEEAKRYIERLNDISFKYNFSKEEIALLFINFINEIDKIIVGVEKIEQLKKNIEALNRAKEFAEIKTAINFKNLFIKNKKIIDPREWLKIL